MSIKNLSNFISSVSNYPKIKFKGNIDIQSKQADNTVEEKKRAVRKEVKKIYHKGVITGVILTIMVGITDCAADYFLYKHYNKKFEEELSHLSGDAKKAKELERPAKEAYIPLISIIKKLFGKIKK